MVLGICEGVCSAGPGAVHKVAGTSGVCDFTLVLSVWNFVITYCICIWACCNCCARFWLDLVKFVIASTWFAAACRSAAVAWSKWFSASAVSWFPLTFLAYADVGAKPLSHSHFYSARRVVLNAAHVRRGLLRRCHSRMVKGNRWYCEITPVVVFRVWP